MEKDDQQVTVCAACDLAARLQVELAEARNQLLAHGSELSKWSCDDDREHEPMACELRRSVREQELRVAAIDDIVAELSCDCRAGSLRPLTECTDAAA